MWLGRLLGLNVVVVVIVGFEGLLLCVWAWSVQVSFIFKKEGSPTRAREEKVVNADINAPSQEEKNQKLKGNLEY